MSGLRLLLTSAAMAAVASALTALAPDPVAAADTLRTAQHVATTTGPDAVVLAAVGLAAWLAWGWGALGLALTAATALPGAAGAAARVAVRTLLPASLRSGAAVALGVGLVVATPAGAFAAPAASAAAVGPVPDWPFDMTRDEPSVPDWPEKPPPAAAHVVAPGECLWYIAADRLRQAGDPRPSHADTAAATAAWWHANRTVIGPDPNLIHPGQVLRPPPP
jgi:hypothetical protein